jgi:large subunit ribosomal protein L37e
MSKGTASKGKHSGKRTHIACRRCGRIAYHMTRSVCASCGYGKSTKMRSYAWIVK